MKKRKAKTVTRVVPSNFPLYPTSAGWSYIRQMGMAPIESNMAKSSVTMTVMPVRLTERLLEMSPTTAQLMVRRSPATTARAMRTIETILCP